MEREEVKIVIPSGARDLAQTLSITLLSRGNIDFECEILHSVQDDGGV
jgi:hypothetical protein